MPVVFQQRWAKESLSRDWSGLRDYAGAARIWALKAFFIPLYTAALIALLTLTYANGLESPLAWLGLVRLLRLFC